MTIRNKIFRYNRMHKHLYDVDISLYFKGEWYTEKPELYDQNKVQKYERRE